ncbi:bacteriocin immunity protein [Clostridium perfringens]|uniref:bacteriocin immunity protein n=1 Tax=Clostridium perfringens TaxID=1502 RepID=UPI0022451B26|nr:bacteriocin immunity protein [Clostridium perfringens]MCX0360729.1 bacteriocin immunity protein [Clostridium perfringens]
MKKDKYYDLVNQLNIALNDSKIKENNDLIKILSEYKHKLETGAEYNLICAQLSKIISEYLLINKFKSPESILNLYKYLSKGNNKYMGMLSITNWF